MTPATIQQTAREIARDNPRLAPGTYVPAYVASKLRALAMDCGMTADAATRASHADLLSVFAVAKSSQPEAAIRTASRIAARFAPPPAPFAPQAPPAPRTEDGFAPQPEYSKEALEAAIAAALAPLTERLEADFKAATEDARTDAATLAIQTMRDALATEAARAAAEALKAQQPTRLEVQMLEAPPVPLGLVHHKTAEIIEDLADGFNVYLHGPAGSGKTTLAKKVAEALGVKAYYAAKVEDEFQLMGFVNGTGYVTTQFRLAYEFGGVFLFDELDASNTAAVVALNMALANGICAFPDALVTRHPQFYCIGAGNTVMGGATEEYQGRNQQDGASIDRFAYTEFGYDEDLERALAPDADWCAYVQAVRAAVKRRGLSHLVTPRATIDGGTALLRPSRTWSRVADKFIWKGLDREVVAELQAETAYAFKGH